jgi:hypothetical protein
MLLWGYSNLQFAELRRASRKLEVLLPLALVP